MKRNWLCSITGALALAAPLTAAAQGELVVYCTVQEEWCRPMVTAFEKATGIKVSMTRKSSGEFYAQLKAEAPTARRHLVGGTGDPHLQAAEEGLTEPYKSPKMAELQDGRCGSGSSRSKTVGVYAGALATATTPTDEEETFPSPSAGPISRSRPSRTRSRSRTRTRRARRTMLATLVQLMGEDKAFEY
jgi:iron(III) transport system substrate-binding protein